MKDLFSKETLQKVQAKGTRLLQDDTFRAIVDMAKTNTGRAAILEGTKIPLKEAGKKALMHGGIGAAIDASLSTYQGVKAVRDGEATVPEAAKHILNETACGAISSATGTACTIAAGAVLGPSSMATLAGIGGAIAARNLYRQVLGRGLNEPEEGEDGDA